MMALEFMLAEKGFSNIVKAFNGQQALARLREGHFDFVLLDNSMPVMSGIECAREIRRLQVAGEVPRSTKVILVSGDVFKREDINDLTQIFDDVLTKPISRDDFLKVISRYTF